MSMRLPGLKYKRVFDRGRVLRARLFTAYALRAEDAGRQAGVIVSRKSFHDAVDRNRAKRILREGFRLMAQRLPADVDWVLVGRAALRNMRTADVMGELQRMAQRCGWC